jgi:co-chaperonin GroES (HSP10)
MIQALGTKLVVTRTEREQTTTSGIIISNLQEQNPTARIVSQGADVTLNCKPGDQVVISWPSTAETRHEGTTYYIVDQTGVFGVIP